MNLPGFFSTILNFFLVYISFIYIHILFFIWLTWYPILIDIKFLVTICFDDAISV